MADIEALRKKVEDAKAELIRSEERLSQANDQVAKIEKEIEDAGASPDTLEEEIDRLEKELAAEEEKIQKAFAKTGEAMKGNTSEEKDEPDDPFEDL